MGVQVDKPPNPYFQLPGNGKYEAFRFSRYSLRLSCMRSSRKGKLYLSITTVWMLWPKCGKDFYETGTSPCRDKSPPTRAPWPWDEGITRKVGKPIFLFKCNSYKGPLVACVQCTQNYYISSL